MTKTTLGLRFGSLISFLILLLAFSLLYQLFNFEGIDDFFPIPPRILSLLKFTLFQAFLSTMISIVLGTLLAWSLVHQNNFTGRQTLIALLSSSLVLPTLVVVFGLISILGQNGWINRALMCLFDINLGSYVYGLSGILIAHVYLNASFATRAILHSLESIPKERYKLAKSLNFSLFKRFLLVEFPAIKLTLQSISITIFLLCFSSFAIVLTLGGSPAYNTLEVAIYEAVRLDFDIPMALKLALIQLSITTILVLISSKIKVSSSNIKANNFTIKETKKTKIFQVFVIFICSFLFILPLISIFIDGYEANFSKLFSNPIFIKSFFTSLYIAFISAILTLTCSIFISEVKRTIQVRIRASFLTNIANILISLSTNVYLAIPSLIIGLGFFLLSLKIQIPNLAIIAIICANILMSLPFSMSVIYPAMQKVAQRYDKLSLSLGLSGLKRWYFCEFGYIKTPAIYVFALSFCLSLGDLGVIALFGSNEVTTLPWYLYQLIGSYQSKDGAGVALMLLVLVLGVFIFLPKLLERKSDA
jgi:thiamine transport system permease protein